MDGGVYSRIGQRRSYFQRLGRIPRKEGIFLGRRMVLRRAPCRSRETEKGKKTGRCDRLPGSVSRIRAVGSMVMQGGNKTGTGPGSQAFRRFIRCTGLCGLETAVSAFAVHR